MPQGDKNYIISRFKTGDRPTEKDWHNIINNSLNLRETNTQTLIQPLNLHSGSFGNVNPASGTLYTSSHAWEEISPFMVPNLHPNLHVFTLDPITFMAASASGTQPSIGNIGSNKFLWEFDQDNGSIIKGGPSSSNTSDINDIDFSTGSGCFSLVTGGSEGNQTAIATSVVPFTCIADQPWWVKTRFKIDDHDNTEFFFGLSERAADVNSWHLTAAGAGTDRVGFVKVAHNADAVTFASTKNGGGTITTAFENAQNYGKDNELVSYGIFWDGSASINFYSDKVSSSLELGSLSPHQMTRIHTYKTTAGIPSDSSMRLCFLLETGDDVTNTATIEYIQGAILTNRPG